MKINVINSGKHQLPAYTTAGSAGLDLQANIEEPILMKPGEVVIVKTGLSIELPLGYEAQIRPRSGMAIKHGITVLNAPGTVDADYRGEIGVILINHGKEIFEINDGERIAQLVIAKHEQITWNPTDELSDTLRGTGGFGSTGK